MLRHHGNGSFRHFQPKWTSTYQVELVCFSYFSIGKLLEVSFFTHPTPQFTLLRLLTMKSSKYTRICHSIYYLKLI